MACRTGWGGDRMAASPHPRGTSRVPEPSPSATLRARRRREAGRYAPEPATFDFDVRDSEVSGMLPTTLIVRFACEKRQPCGGGSGTDRSKGPHTGGAAVQHL